LPSKLSDSGILDKYNVKLIAPRRSHQESRDRLYFKMPCRRIGLDVPKSLLVNNLKMVWSSPGKLDFQ